MKCLNFIGRELSGRRQQRESDLVRRLSLPVLQLLGVLLPDGENPVVAAKVVSARRLAILLSDWTNSKNTCSLNRNQETEKERKQAAFLSLPGIDKLRPEGHMRPVQ